MTSLLDAALDYDSRGWRVIALHSLENDGRGMVCSCSKGHTCTSTGKHPKNNKWQDTPRPSTADLYATWDPDTNGGGTLPNIGIATGSVSGFWVLDIDPDHAGAATMAALVAEHGALPATFVAQTGSGGYHYYFALPEDFVVKNDQSGRVGQGIDVRGEGGQVVAPPSRTDKGSYTIVTDRPVAAAPAWLLQLVRKDQVEHDIVTAEDLPKPDELDEATWKRLTAYAGKAVKANTDRLRAMGAARQPDMAAYRGEPWNHTTFEVACSLIEIANSPWNAYSLGQAQADLLAHAPRDREFDDTVVLRCWSSARDRVGEKARPMPEDRRAEPDPLFSSPEVRDQTRSGPTEAGGAEGAPTGGLSPYDYFDEGKKSKPLYGLMGRSILDQGPIAWGADRDWWSYNGGVWRPDSEVVARRASRMLGDMRSKNIAAELHEHLRHHEETPAISGDPLPGLMNFRNTMLDWQTGQTFEHDQAYLSTVQFPVDYTPDATCPNFDRFLADVMHEDYVDLVWEMLGYLMYSGNKLQVAFLLYGSGGNGKGTLVRVIEAILGSENIANEPLDRLNGDRFSTVNLFSKIANIAGDIDATYQESTANFKRLTGEDTLAAERKYGDRFRFENWAVPLFSANKIPGSSDVSAGYLRRWIVIHFHKRILNPTPGLSNLLETEVEGIAAKAVLALRRLMERGKFDPQGKATEGAEEFAEAIDQVRQWIASDDVVAAPGTPVLLRTLYQGYSSWAGATNRGRINESEFAHRLEACGVPSTITGNTTYFVGIKARDFTHEPVPVPELDEFFGGVQ